ncbi:SDR family oxidoreductase [uncultured Phenylobacterium sp.]|uniref:SDR family NAD(P)-dependent oxidoreductase n=1 Tax=uncultured Phenylobacterium sp. TaxID=349273 RepID=UPI0025EF672F|nr:SDR family oxidoreductase [uncultured Phenylobacterium sp.]
MVSGRFAGARVLVTSADAYMGPAISQRFRDEDAEVITDGGRYLEDAEEPARIVAAAGQVDVLVINLAPTRVGSCAAQDQTEDQWQLMFDGMAHPTMRFTKAVLPQMIARRQGKIVVVTSAAPLRGSPGAGAYSAARGAQNAYVRAVGAEAAQHNVQINAIGQNFVYGGYPANAMEKPRLREIVLRDVPAQRLAEGWEQAELVLFLASQNSNFISGQVIPFAGGWVTST